MADRKISDLTALTAPASGDYLPIVDISEAAAASKNKRITIEELFRGVPLGTAAAPSIAIEGDEDTGVYSPGANPLAISTGGSSRLFVDASGRVGITTGSPAAGLDINNTAYTRGGHKVSGYFATSAGDGYVINIGASGSINYIQSLNGTTQAQLSIDGNPIVFRGASFAEIARFDTSGRLGVGTSSPTYRLNIAVASDASLAAGADGFLINTLDASSIARPCGIVRTGSSYSYLGVGANRNCLYSNGTLAIQSDTAGIEFCTGNSLKAVLDSSGRLGIGTSSPGTILDVVGAGNPTLTIRGSDGAYTGILNIQAAGGGTSSINATGGSNALKIETNSVERLRIDSSGRLLVGTSSYTGNSKFAITGGAGTDVALLDLRFGGARPTAADSGICEIRFGSPDQTSNNSYAKIECITDGASSSNTDLPARLVFSTTPDGLSTPTERMRINAAGNVLCNTTSAGSAGGVNGQHTFSHSTSSQWSTIVQHTTAAGNIAFGLGIKYTAATPNSTSSEFLYCEDATTLRASIRSNGGLANFSANNANLSDRNAKKDISSAAGTWDCIKEWEIVNYRYKDQPDDADLNLGVIAQQVAESCPEVITVFSEATEEQPEKLGVKEQQMYWMAIKALQEAQVRIEQLETEKTTQQTLIDNLITRVAALEAQ